MDIPKQVISMGLKFAEAIKKKLDDSGELELINATAVVVTEDMGELMVEQRVMTISLAPQNYDSMATLK